MSHGARLALVSMTLLVLAAPVSASTAVLLKLEATGEELARTATAADGSFRFENVAPGTYVLDVLMDGRFYATRLRGAARPAAKNAGAQLWNGHLEVTSPRDVATGQASGKRTHEPVRFTKEWGPASPKLAVTVDGTTVSGSVTVASTASVRTD
jgi:hypothetical protein